MPVPATESAQDQVIDALVAALEAGLDGDAGVYTDISEGSIKRYHVGVYDLISEFPAIILHDVGIGDDPKSLTGKGGNHFNVKTANLEVELQIREVVNDEDIGTKINRLVADFERVIYLDHTLGGVVQDIWHTRSSRFRLPETYIAGAVIPVFVQYRVYRDDPYTLVN